MNTTYWLHYTSHISGFENYSYYNFELGLEYQIISILLKNKGNNLEVQIYICYCHISCEPQTVILNDFYNTRQYNDNYLFPRCTTADV